MNRFHDAPEGFLEPETMRLLDQYLQKQLELASEISETTRHSGSMASFTKGFVIGQLSVIVVVAIFIKFFVFSESVPKNSGVKKSVLITNETKIIGNLTSSPEQKSPDKSGGSPHKTNSPDEVESESTVLINTILEKTYYNVNTHQTESLDWFNVLVAQIITQFRSEALFENNIVHSLNEFLSEADRNHKMPDWLDTVKINEINIGNDFPIFSNCRITKSKQGKLEAKIDVDLADTLTLAIETKILINKPKFLTAALPIKLLVSIVRFSGCLSISLDSNQIQENTEKDVPIHLGGVLNFGFGEGYRLEFKTESLIGARSKLENVPKISYLIENQLKNWFVERCVEPRFQSIPLPNMWPRKKNTRT